MGEPPGRVVDSGAVTRTAGLEEIVRAQLREPVYALVDQITRELVDERLAATPAAVTSNGTANVAQLPETKRCKTCAEVKPLGLFDKHRHECRACRQTRQRELRETHRASTATPAGDAEVPRPAER